MRTADKCIHSTTNTTKVNEHDQKWKETIEPRQVDCKNEVKTKEEMNDHKPNSLRAGIDEVGVTVSLPYPPLPTEYRLKAEEEGGGEVTEDEDA